MPLRPAVFSLLAAFLLLASCASHESQLQRRDDANTPAGKVGQAAHKASVEADKAGRVIGQKLQQAAHDAHEGWKEDQRKQKDKR
jgi:hypothetical protein